MSRIIRLLICVGAFLSCSLQVVAQDKGGPPPPNKTIDPPFGLVVPIDESLIYLLVAGLFLGIYFYLKSTEAQSD